MNAQALFQPLGHGPGQGPYLLNIVDLAVQHSAAAMLCHLNLHGSETAPGGLTHNTDNAAGPNVQGENHVPVLGS